MSHKLSPFYSGSIIALGIFITAGLAASFVLGADALPAVLMSFFLGIALPVIVKFNLTHLLLNSGLVLVVAALSWLAGIYLLICFWLPSLQFGSALWL